MKRGGIQRPAGEMRIVQPVEDASELPEKETQLLNVVTHDKPKLDTPHHDTHAMVKGADMGDVVDIEDLIITEETDKKRVEKFKKDIIESLVSLQNTSKSKNEDATKKPHITAKGKRILQQYIPRLFDEKPRTNERTAEQDAPFQIKDEPLSPANIKGVARLLESAGFNPETTTLGIVRAELAAKKAEVEEEIEKRRKNKKAHMEIGFEAPVQKQEALEVLQDLIGIEDAPKKEKPLIGKEILKKAAKETEDRRSKEQEKNDLILKPIIAERIKREIDVFARQFTERYESEGMKKKLAEQRHRATEISIKPMKPPTRWQRLVERLSPKEIRDAKEAERQKLSEEKEAQEYKKILHKNPTFTKEGFLQSTNLLGALDDLKDPKFDAPSQFKNLREKIAARIFKNEQRLKETYSADLGKKPIETLTQLVDVDDYDLKRVLANNEVLERILEIIDRRNVFLSGTEDLSFEEEKLSNPTTEFYQRFSTMMPEVDSSSRQKNSDEEKAV